MCFGLTRLGDCFVGICCGVSGFCRAGHSATLLTTNSFASLSHFHSLSHHRQLHRSLAAASRLGWTSSTFMDGHHGVSSLHDNRNLNDATVNRARPSAPLKSSSRHINDIIGSNSPPLFATRACGPRHLPEVVDNLSQASSIDGSRVCLDVTMLECSQTSSTTSRPWPLPPTHAALGDFTAGPCFIGLDVVISLLFRTPHSA